MEVRFLEDVSIRGQISVSKGNVFDAYEEGDFIMILMPDESIVKAPKSEIDGILEIIK